jgi:hypothetical protein
MRRVGGVVAFLLILGLAAAGFVNQVLLASLAGRFAAGKIFTHPAPTKKGGAKYTWPRSRALRSADQGYS